MKAKQQVPALRGGQPGDLASNRGSCDRISLQRASMRRKITLNNPGIWGMSDKAIVDAGFLLQIDDPDLPDGWACLPDITVPIATPCKTAKNLVILPLWVAFFMWVLEVLMVWYAL